MKRVLQFAAAVMLLASAAGAQQSRIYNEGSRWVREVTGTLAGGKELRVRIDSGSVRVEGGSQQDVTYAFRSRARSSAEEKARREFDTYKISAYVHGETAWIVAEWQGGNPRRFSGEFVINVPSSLRSVNVQTSGGGITANHIAGRVEAESGGGPIRVDDIGGPVRASTGGDSIEVGSVRGDLDVETGGGRVDITSAKGNTRVSTGGGDVVLLSGQGGATLESGGGNIEARQCGGPLRVSTGGGNIEIGDVSGPAEIQTGGGSIRVGSAKGLVRAETGAGRIELNGVPAALVESGAGGIIAKFLSMGGQRVDSKLETGAGDVTVYLAPNVSITIRASIEMASGHNIYTDFPELKVTKEGEWGLQTIAAEGSLNGGGPLLKVQTATGNIQFKRTGR